jgi:hypothetical protein
VSQSFMTSRYFTVKISEKSEINKIYNFLNVLAMPLGMTCQSMKQWIRLAMVVLVGLLVFSLSMPGVALSPEIEQPVCFLI